MYKLRLVLLLPSLLLAAVLCNAQSTLVDLPRASQHAIVIQRVGITDIKINRKYVLYAHDGKSREVAGSRGKRRKLAAYFGQPSAGFFFLNDLVTAFSQSPLIFRSAGFGPGVAAFLVSDFAAFFIGSPKMAI